MPAAPLRLCLVVSLILATPGLAQQGPPNVVVANPIAETVVDWDVFTGRFQAVESVMLQARVSGYLNQIHFQEGELIQAGQVLFEIDQRPFDAALDEAEATRDVYVAQRELAQIELDRARELVERGARPQSEADQALAEFQQAEANVALAEAGVMRAELDVEFTLVSSPITGRVSEHYIDVGNLVVGGPNGATELANVVSVDPIEFVFTVSEADYLQYARLEGLTIPRSTRDTPRPVYIQLMDEDTWERQGELSFVDNQLDPNSGTLLGRATLENTDGLLQPGAFGRVRVQGSPEYEALLIPDDALLADQSDQIAYVVNDEDVVEIRTVETGPMHRGMRVIRGGLEPGDRVIISGLQRARPGSPVAPQSEDLTAQLEE